jgi:prevent-host-death family protein
MALIAKNTPRRSFVTLEVNIHEAKTHLSKLLQRVMAGEEIIIAKSGTPVARIVPIVAATKKRIPGSARGKIRIAPDFDAPLPEAVLQEFEGGQ